MKPNPLKLVADTPIDLTREELRRPPLVESRVVGIQFSRRDEHEFRSIMAWRKREHPGWSQFWSGLEHQ